jgi:hypothetical protein
MMLERKAIKLIDSPTMEATPLSSLSLSYLFSSAKRSFHNALADEDYDWNLFASTSGPIG